MELISTKKAAEILGVSTAYVRRLIIDGKIPATKLGRDHILNKSAVEAFRRNPPGRPAKK